MHLGQVHPSLLHLRWKQNHQEQMGCGMLEIIDVGYGLVQIDGLVGVIKM